MPYVRTVSYDEAKGELKSLYDQMLEAHGTIPNVYAVNSIRPHLMKTLSIHNSGVMGSDSGLSPAERQMIATVVSALNNCQY
jgi:alkylhydroperoxidase family enzyme